MLKNRYAKHTCIKALSHGAIFLATCNAILLLIDVKLANTRFHHSLLIIFLTYCSPYAKKLFDFWRIVTASPY